jgi:hypothetical protein
MQSPQPRIIPIYTSKGDVGAFLIFPYIFNIQGEWIGWITRERQVYSVLGSYVGYLTNDPRIVRHDSDSPKPHLTPPPPPTGRINTPPSTPLAPMMSDLTIGLTDVLLNDTGRLHTIDHGELMDDMD